MKIPTYSYYNTKRKKTWWISLLRRVEPTTHASFCGQSRARKLRSSCTQAAAAATHKWTMTMHAPRNGWIVPPWFQARWTDRSRLCQTRLRLFNCVGRYFTKYIQTEFILFERFRNSIAYKIIQTMYPFPSARNHNMDSNFELRLKIRAGTGKKKLQKFRGAWEDYDSRTTAEAALQDHAWCSTLRGCTRATQAGCLSLVERNPPSAADCNCSSWAGT